MKNLIDFSFLLCLICSPIVALIARKDWHPFLAYVSQVFQPEYIAGTIAGMCGQMLIIIGAPFLLAYLLSKDNRPTFRAWFVGAWLVVSAFVIIGSRL